MVVEFAVNARCVKILATVIGFVGLLELWSLTRGERHHH
jgi:hypothetical protein